MGYKITYCSDLAREHSTKTGNRRIGGIISVCTRLLAAFCVLVARKEIAGIFSQLEELVLQIEQGSTVTDVFTALDWQIFGG